MPKFSIILPISNDDKIYLHNCLDNISKQTYKDLEILCIGQVLAEGTYSIIQNFAEKDSRIKILSYEVKNEAGAKNLGITKATGDYCYFANPRDLIAPILFEYAAILFNTFDMDYFCFGSKIVKEADSKINTQKEQEELLIKQDGLFDLSFDVALKANFAIFNKIFKTSIVKDKNITFPENLETCDIPFICLYDFSAKKIYFDDCIYHYHKILDNEKTNLYTYAVLYIQSWDYICEQLKSVKGLIEENFDNLVELLNICTQKAKLHVRPIEKYKIEKLKWESLDKLNEIILNIERERQRIKLLEEERIKSKEAFNLPSISEEVQCKIYSVETQPKMFGISSDPNNPNCKILNIFGLAFPIKK